MILLHLVLWAFSVIVGLTYVAIGVFTDYAMPSWAVWCAGGLAWLCAAQHTIDAAVRLSDARKRDNKEED